MDFSSWSDDELRRWSDTTTSLVYGGQDNPAWYFHAAWLFGLVAGIGGLLMLFQRASTQEGIVVAVGLISLGVAFSMERSRTQNRLALSAALARAYAEIERRRHSTVPNQT